jgi:EmrB/QacA subfamily drug resistance transporter
MDATVLTTALPTMAHELRAPVTELSAALTSYLLALAVFIPASGRIADRFGAKTVFRLAIVIFLAGSVLCGQANHLPLLIGARFLQGVGGAMMLPIGRLVLLRSVPREDLVRAMSWLIIPAMLGPVAGPPLGGFIVTYLNWRWIFYLNLPIGLLGIVLVTRFIGEIKAQSPKRLDVFGFLLSSAALGCVLVSSELALRPQGLIRGLILLGIGAVSAVAYVSYARRAADPILDVTLMRVPTFRMSVLAGSLIRITQGAQALLLPLMLQLGFGLNAALSGSITVAGALGAFGMKWIAPRFLQRFGFRNIMIFNGLLGCIGYAACGLMRPSWPLGVIFGLLGACGFVMSLQFTAYNTIAYDEISAPRMSDATSFYSTFQQLTLSLGICAGAGVLHVAMAARRTHAPDLWDFSIAFFTVAGISALATIWHVRMSPTAGDDMSGRTRSRALRASS